MSVCLRHEHGPLGAASASSAVRANVEAVSGRHLGTVPCEPCCCEPHSASWSTLRSSVLRRRQRRKQPHAQRICHR
eukprot:12026554-Alexandrium_andersonii.AAC.1